jgi:NAD(P)-dependent dehydrogenase (short-subunit alcohol dehydrogenase family)
VTTETGTKPDQTQQQDPREQQPTPPFPQQQQEPPGTEAELTPKADHGQESYRGFGRLKDKVALITGADSGIGRAVAIAFAREGADVVISYLNEEQDAAETERWVTEAGRRAVSVAGDIGEEEHSRRLVERTVQELGKLDILVNNAAWQDSGDTIAEMTSEEWRRIMRTNLDAMFYLSKAAMDHLPEGGTIINVTSIQAYDPSPNLLPYATTKGGIVTFTKALAKEAIEKGIRVNGVAPGPIWTPLIPSTMPPEKGEKFGEDTPTGRAGQPAELAPVFVFLASQESSYITGEVIGVTGGEPLR